jgi:hypothetical protein
MVNINKMSKRKVRVLYAKNPHPACDKRWGDFYYALTNGNAVKDITRSFYDKYWVQVIEINNKNIVFDEFEEIKYVEHLFSVMNNCAKNPLTKKSKQEFIRKHDLHTSMSVGDVVIIGNKKYIIKDYGVERLRIRR